MTTSNDTAPESATARPATQTRAYRERSGSTADRAAAANMLDVNDRPSPNRSGAADGSAGALTTDDRVVRLAGTETVTALDDAPLVPTSGATSGVLGVREASDSDHRSDAETSEYIVEYASDPEPVLLDLTQDPRFTARITEIEVDRLRRRSFVLLAVLATIAVVAIGSIVVRAAIFDVDQVNVQGANRETVDTILDAAAIRNGIAIWSVDVGAAEARVEELPWIADARVDRRWPDEIVISVREYTATAFVRAADGTVALFGPDGRVLEYEATPPPGIIEIVGAREVPAVGEIFFPPGVGALMVEIPDALRDRVASIDVSEGVTLRLAPSGQVRLCDATDLARKGAVALALLEQDAAAQSIDVCVPTSPTTR